MSQVGCVAPKPFTPKDNSCAYLPQPPTFPLCPLMTSAVMAAERNSIYVHVYTCMNV